MKTLVLSIFTLVFAFGIVHDASAQQKIKPPKLYTFIGTVKDSVTRSVAETQAMLDKPLRITDDKQGVYSVSSYQFLYRKNIAIEDDESGKVTRGTALQSQRFRESPLPAIWVKNIREELQPGELLYFFDIIVKDDKGRVMYAPDLKIIVK